MWERGARHNPVSLRYKFYMDHRPFLPQDPTLSFIRNAEGNYGSFFYTFILPGGKRKFIYSNNIPVNDREDFKNIIYYDSIFRSSFKYLAFIGSIFLYNGLTRGINFGNKHWAKFLTFAGLFYASNIIISNIYLNHYNDITNNYYYKYQHFAVDDINDVKDPRREFFYLDKSSYYRETSQEIRHNSHHPASQGHDHDTSTYYGPYPVKFFLFFIRFYL